MNIKEKMEMHSTEVDSQEKEKLLKDLRDLQKLMTREELIESFKYF